MAGEPLDPRHHRADRRQVDLVVAAVPNLIGRAQPGAAVRAHAGLGDEDRVGLGAQPPPLRPTLPARGPARPPVAGRSALRSDDGGWLELSEVFGGSPNFASSTAMRACRTSTKRINS
jgi:hypothetical protein